jgi:hypothetical protein
MNYSNFKPREWAFAATNVTDLINEELANK